MEYLASGRPIVASYTASYQKYAHLIEMGRGEEEFLAKFDFTIKNLEKLSSDSMILARKSIALDNTYDRQIERIEQIIASR